VRAKILGNGTAHRRRRVTDSGTLHSQNIVSGKIPIEIAAFHSKENTIRSYSSLDI
jgi:hypothetical protein